MLSETCPHCGKSPAEGAGADADSASTAAVAWSGVSITQEEAAADSAPIVLIPDIGYSQSGVVEHRPSSRGRLLLLGLLGVAVALLAINLLRSTEDANNESTVADLPATAGLDGSSVVSGPDLGAGNGAPTDDPLTSQTIADQFRTSINGERNYSIVYPVNQQLRLLNEDGATDMQMDVAVGFEQVLKFPMISDGRRTWAVNPDDQSTAFLVSTQFVVVDTELEGSVAFINTLEDPPVVGISSFGAWGPGYPAPPGAEIMAVAGRGILMVPQTGGTFLATSGGPERLSVDRVVAAAQASEIYERCDESLVCELYVTNSNGDNSDVLDLSLDSDLTISPNGAWVFSRLPDDSIQILEVATGLIWTPSATAPVAAAAAWAPDESFVAFIAGSDVVVAFPEEKRVETLRAGISSFTDSLLVVSPEVG